MVKLLVFDWDGTLMDSEQEIIRCMQAAIVDMDWIMLDTATIRNIIGLGLIDAVAALFPDKTAAQHQAAADRYRAHFLSESNQGSNLFPNAEQILKQCHAEGYLMAVATGKGRAGLNKVLGYTGLGQYFHATRSADETASKPDPLMLVQIMRQLETEPEHTLMVGDTEYDMKMAVNAGAIPLAVSYGVHHIDRLTPYADHPHLDAISELPAWLKNNA